MSSRRIALSQSQFPLEKYIVSLNMDINTVPKNAWRISPLPRQQGKEQDSTFAQTFWSFCYPCLEILP